MTSSDTRRAHPTDVLDDALDRLAAYRWVDGPGMAVHAPMGAEALVGLGHADVVADWVEAYKARHEPIDGPAPVGGLDPADLSSWRPALGDPSRLTDWHDLFARRLAEEPWSDVVRTWVPRLLPGYGGAFTHGLLRTSHAVRALSRTAGVEPSALLLGELAMALAYWAGTFLPLPGDPGLRGDRPLAAALDALPRPADPGWSMMEAAQFTRIDELTGFPAAVAAHAAPAGSVDDALSDLTRTFARLLPALPEVHPFALVHALTPVAAARALLPHLPGEAHLDVYRAVWHVDAAIAAGFVPKGVASDATDLGEPPTPAELVARAVEHRDPHAIKYTAACLSEHARHPDPAYLQAAHHTLTCTTPW